VAQGNQPSHGKRYRRESGGGGGEGAREREHIVEGVKKVLPIKGGVGQATMHPKKKDTEELLQARGVKNNIAI